MSQENPSSPESLSEKITRLRLEVYNRLGTLETAQLIYKFGMQIKKRYPDSRRYRIFHILIGSGIPEDFPKNEIIEEDFPGEDSVEKFLESLISKEENESHT